MDKVRVIELFAGYGSQHLALKRLQRDYPQFEYEVVAFCEIEDSAIKAYQALHGDQIPNLGDITKVSPYDVPDCDLMTWSFPCTDISSAGVQKGLAEGSDTRSSLCWDAMRIFEVKRPKYLLMENVAALVSEKFVKDFNMLQLSLQKMGYTNFVRLINAKDMGVPQNRLRIFMVSILDCPRAYYFPKPFKLQRRLKDVLEQNVDERYYLKEDAVRKLTANIDGLEAGQHLLNGDSEGNASTITTGHDRALNITQPKGGHKQMGVLEIAEPTIAAMRGRDKDNPNDRGKSTDNYTQRLELKPDGTSNTLTSVAKDNLLIEPTIIDATNDFSEEEKRTYTEYSPTLRSSRSGLMTTEGIRIRRLTERELYRLMDLEETDIDTLLNSGISKTQHCRLAGNSIVVNVLYHIFRTMFIDTVPLEGTQTTLF